MDCVKLDSMFKKAIGKLFSGGGSSSPIRIKLPELVPATYIVPVETLPTDPKSAVAEAIKRHVTGFVSELTLDLLKSEQMLIVDSGEKEKFPALPPEILAAMGASEDQLSALTKSKYVIVVRSLNTIGWPPYHEFGGRAAAAAIAIELNSNVVDVVQPAILSADHALSSLPNETGNIHFPDWFRVVMSSEKGGLWITTKGLCRFGLPDLQALEVPPQLDNAMTSVMTGIGWNISQRFIAHASKNRTATHFDLPAVLDISEADIAEAYGSESSESESVKIQLRFDAMDDDYGFLTLVKPSDEKESFGEYMVKICGSLCGATRRRVFYTQASDEMEAAMAKARAEIPDIRSRFLAGEFQLGAQLIVKFEVSDGENTEFLWAFVTDWTSMKDPTASCGNDSRFDPELRTGKTVTLDIDKIVDWALLHNDEMIEGGYTNKVLLNQA
jgi:uncharacterized protein YegJ (DUF2314 family)